MFTGLARWVARTTWCCRQAPGCDQYVITGLLGRGGFGITYLVHDAALRKDFALKEFFPEDFVFRESVGGRVRARPDSEKEYQWGLRKFYDEARLLVQFSHPNIVGGCRLLLVAQLIYAVGATLYRGISGDRPPEAPLRQNPQRGLSRPHAARVRAGPVRSHRGH